MSHLLIVDQCYRKGVPPECWPIQITQIIQYPLIPKIYASTTQWKDRFSYGKSFPFFSKGKSVFEFYKNSNRFVIVQIIIIACNHNGPALNRMWITTTRAFQYKKVFELHLILKNTHWCVQVKLKWSQAIEFQCPYKYFMCNVYY